MYKYLLTLIGFFVFIGVNAQTFYSNTVVNYQIENRTFQLNVLNCDSSKIHTCPPTNNIVQFFENTYSDIAIDSNQNIYYVSSWGSLYKRNLADTSSCQFLGTFGHTINALVTDVMGNVFAAGNENSLCTLYKYEVHTNSFSTVGTFPSTFFSAGDLFFYEGKLFLTATNSIFTNSFLVQVNLSNTSQSCYYMDLQNLHPWGAFCIKSGLLTKAYLISTDTIFTDNFKSSLFEIDLLSKTISSPICTYPYQITGAASVYSFTTDTSVCTSLPIKLSSFNYALRNKKVELIWETLSEFNNNYFLIEKSLTGDNFETIGKRIGAVNSNTLKQYSFIDNNPSNTNYYRLKQVDLDGKSTQSNVLFVKVPKTNPLQIIQNLIKGTIQTQVNVEPSFLVVLDMFGRKVKSFKAQIGFQNFDVSTIPPGIYILQLVTTDKQTFNERFIKSGY